MMGKLIEFPTPHRDERQATHMVRFWSDVIALKYGPEYGEQILYAWSQEEADGIAKERNGRVEAI